MSVSIKYELTGRGWSECTIDIYDITCRLNASYLSDALKDFVWAVNYMVKGGTEFKFSFNEEPGEYRWILNQPRTNTISIEIREFEEEFSKKEDSLGKIIYEATCPIYEFAIALKTDLDSILEKYGLDEYRKKWGREFPVIDYQELCSLLGKPYSNKALQVMKKK